MLRPIGEQYLLHEGNTFTVETLFRSCVWI